jgi:hypothetical protein
MELILPNVLLLWNLTAGFTEQACQLQPFVGQLLKELSGLTKPTVSTLTAISIVTPFGGGDRVHLAVHLPRNSAP